jgi:hypothetical protein
MRLSTFCGLHRDTEQVSFTYFINGVHHCFWAASKFAIRHQVQPQGLVSSLHSPLWGFVEDKYRYVGNGIIANRKVWVAVFRILKFFFLHRSGSSEPYLDLFDPVPDFLYLSAIVDKKNILIHISDKKFSSDRVKSTDEYLRKMSSYLTEDTVQ